MEADDIDEKIESGYILVSLPENYRLYEHVKKTEKDGRTEVKNKTHAAGGNDRQDAYLYGHPHGKRKRFRSPNDFFPHLLWLCTDESGDPDNCTCKLCSPEDLENLVPGAKVKLEKHVKQEQEAKPSVSQHGAQMSRQPSLQGTTVKQEPRPVSRQALPATRQPTPLPPPRDPDQKMDRQYHTFMYRPGELVWFKRGQAWGLGCVLRRWIAPTPSNDPNRYYYTVQPLSYPFQHLEAVVKASNSEMRPWLAWSVPRFTNDGLNNMPDPPRYETADWQGMMQHRYGNGDMEVDGSILAAKAVDSTYTPFGQTQSLDPEPGVREIHYNGLFLGAEKIWVGDPVRLHLGSGTDIMVLHSVIERRRTSAVNTQTLQQEVKLLGDVYTLSQVAHPDPSIPTPASPNANPHLPPRLTDDLGYRNNRSIHARRAASYWKLVAPQQRLGLNDVKGRWYEASLMLPILQPQLFEDAVRKGEIQESSLWMNSRGDCLNSNRAPQLPRLPKENVRTETRKGAFGKALPANAEIKDGVAPPLPDNVDPSLDGPGGVSTTMDIDPRFDTADDAGKVGGGGDLEEFMNLDGIEGESMPGFGGGQSFYG